MDSKVILRIVVIFLIWRTLFFVLSAIAPIFLPYAPSFPYATSLLPSFNLPQWIYSFANFDGVHYLTIAKEGYLKTNFIQAFFPLYPFVLLHGIYKVFSSANLMTLGLLISNLSFLGFLIIGFDLISKQFSQKTAWHFIFAVLAFPWSFFLASLYTESLFLFLVVLCFWFAQKKNWLAAGLIAVLVSATRIVGVFIVPALLVELYVASQAQKSKTFNTQTLLNFVKKRWKEIGFILLGVLGLLAYMTYLQVNFHDPLYFLHVQSSFGAGRSTSIILYPQVVWRGLKILLTVPFDFKYITYFLEFLAGTLGLVAILLASLPRSNSVVRGKKVSLGLTVFSLGVFLFPTLSGSFLSMGRFLLPCLSIYILIAMFARRNKKLGMLWFTFSIILLIVNTILFIQGYWVA